ncbi:MAG: hypothetical protein HQL50_01390 [Magnetococcales bacterium]|nr:hypothetical protein [Magnetococcales bacterium]
MTSRRWPPRRTAKPSKETKSPVSRVTLPVWWRRLSGKRALTTVRRRYRHDGHMPLARTIPLDVTTLTALTPAELPRSGRVGDESQEHLQHALESLDHKLDHLVSTLTPGLAESPNPTPTPLPARVGPNGFTLWLTKEDAPTKGDHLECHIYLTGDAALPLRCFATVLRTVPDQGPKRLTRVDLSYASAEGDNKRRILRHVTAMRRRARAQAAAAKPVPKPTPKPLPKPEPAQKPTVVSPAPPPPQPKPAPPTDGANRREAFRVNDDLPFGWHLISEQEFSKAAAAFQEHDEIPERAQLDEFDDLLTTLDGNLKRLRPTRTRALEPLAAMRDRIHQLVHAANTEQEETLFYRMLLRLSKITEMRRFSPESAMIIIRMREYLTALRQSAGTGRLLSAQGRERIRVSAERLQEQIPSLIGKQQGKEPDLAKVLMQLLDDMGKVDFTHLDRSVVSNRTNLPLMTIYPVNISATGIAFRTLKDSNIIPAGAPLLMQLGLSEKGTEHTLHPVLARVVIVLPPEEDGRYRIACQTTHMSTASLDVLHVHIVRRQRELLSKRSTVL